MKNYDKYKESIKYEGDIMDIYIYTNYPKESNKDNTIYNNDARFNNYTINNLHGDLDDIGKEVIKQIDRAIILENNKIETPRGITYLTDLSSGCKTVLNYLYADKEYLFINVTQCGANALEILFQTMEKVPNIQRKLILCHKDRIYKCNKRNYVINNKKHIEDLLYI